MTFLNPPPPVGGSRYGGPALTTLELVAYPETILSENALRSLTSLRSLTVRYRYIREGIECRLRSWLSHLQQLKTLSIIGQSQFALHHSCCCCLTSTYCVQFYIKLTRPEMVGQPDLRSTVGY